MNLNVRKELDWCIEHGNTGPRSHALLLAIRTLLAGAESVPMTDAPARIHLVIEDGGALYSSFAKAREQANMSDGIKWCEDRFSDSDIAYVRADLVATPAPVSENSDESLTWEDVRYYLAVFVAGALGRTEVPTLDQICASLDAACSTGPLIALPAAFRAAQSQPQQVEQVEVKGAKP